MAGYVGATPTGTSKRDGHFEGAIASRAEDGERCVLAHPAVGGNTIGGRPDPQRAVEPIEGERVFARASERNLVTWKDSASVDDGVVDALGSGRIDLTRVDLDRR